MERLTRRSNVGEYLPVNHLNIRHEDTTSEDTLTEILDRLGAYEDLEVTPEQIREIDKLYAEKCEELTEYQKAQLELSQLIADIKKDFNKDDTYSVSLVLELLESVQIGGSENETN